MLENREKNEFNSELENLSPTLMLLKNCKRVEVEPFKTPDLYFEQFPMMIQSQINEQKKGWFFDVSSWFKLYRNPLSALSLMMIFALCYINFNSITTREVRSIATIQMNTPSINSINIDEIDDAVIYETMNEV
jgi:hypothetical protein